MFLSVTLVLLFSLGALFSLFANYVVAESWLLCWNKVVALTPAPLLHDGLAYTTTVFSVAMQPQQHHVFSTRVFLSSAFFYIFTTPRAAELRV